MDYFVIGEDKSLEKAYTQAEVDAQVKAVENDLESANTAIQNLQNTVNGINNNKITSGTAAPSGGSNGDIYIQY